MIKQLTLALCISLPLVAMAADANKDRKKEQGDKKPVVEAPVQATTDTNGAQPAGNKHNVRKAEIVRQQSRRSAMGYCMKAATDQGLSGPELKQSIGECMKTR